MRTEKIYVTIKGPVSSMKSPIAKMIDQAISKMRPDWKCKVYDHELFAFDNHFHVDLDRTCMDAADSDCNVCVIVIGTGIVTDNEPLTIEIEPAIYGAAILFHTIVDYLTEKE